MVDEKKLDIGKGAELDPIREIKKALNPGRLFDPRQEAGTVDVGQMVKERTPELLLDPAKALAFWMEIGMAWLRLFNPVVAAPLSPGKPRPAREYELFISHAKRDEQAVAAFRRKLDALKGVKSFVDWIDAPERDRTNVSVKTAAWLRDTMGRSRAMVLLLSEHSAQSFWVQWELGYFDALRGHVFLVPLDPGAREAIKQQQYFDLYPMFETPESLIAALREQLGLESIEGDSI